MRLSAFILMLVLTGPCASPQDAGHADVAPAPTTHADAGDLYDALFGSQGGDFEDPSQALIDALNSGIAQGSNRTERRAKLIAFLKKHPKDFPSWKEKPDGISVVAGHFPIMFFDNRWPDVADDAGE